MTTCDACGGRSTIALCPRCQSDLAKALNDLPSWVEALADQALRRTRGGDGGRTPHGDSQPLPFDGDTEKGRQTRQGRARDLLAIVRNSLTTIVRDLCEQRGVRVPFSGRGATCAALCQYLAAHVATIAISDGAAETFHEIKDYRAKIEKIIDPPERRVWLGYCPTWDERARLACGVSLWAPENAVETRCHRCRGLHGCDRLKLLLFNDLERKKVTWDKILRANKSQPEDRQVSERTLQWWRKAGKLKIHGYRRPDGREGISRHGEDDEPLYLWPDIRKLRDAKPQKMPTGAGAHK